MCHFGPKLKIVAGSSHVKTKKDRKRSRIPMEIVSEITFKTFRFMLGPLGLF